MNCIKSKKDSFNAIKLNNCKELQHNGVHPYDTYCISCNGEFSLYKHTTKKEILEFTHIISIR